MPLTAITRDVSPSINNCELSFNTREAIDLSQAVKQHEAYRHCLEQCGARVVSLPAEPDLPDSVFVEDTAIVLDELAVIARMGALSRRPETQSIAGALGAYRPLQYLTEPATLDGGDVLRIGRTLFVGLSRRTNRKAIEQLQQLLRPYGYEVQAVQVRHCLHLKSACSYLGNNTVLINRSWIDTETFSEFELLDVAEAEPGAANALLVDESVIMPASSPQTCKLVKARGFRVRTIDVSELQKAEAGVTCCSLLFDHGKVAR